MDPELRDRLNTETGKLSWAELAPHFARGVVVRVAPELDLIAVAESVVRDDHAQFRSWLESGAIARACDEDARTWESEQPVFWAVVTAPWVLVQPIERGEN
jgi:hypothetical protein